MFLTPKVISCHVSICRSIAAYSLQWRRCKTE